MGRREEKSEQGKMKEVEKEVSKGKQIGEFEEEEGKRGRRKTRAEGEREEEKI